MALDTRIPLAAVQPRRNLTDQYAQAMQLRAMQGQMQAQEAALQRDATKRNALKGAYGPDGFDFAKAEQALLEAQDPESALSMREMRGKDEERRAKTKTAKLKQAESEIALIGNVLYNVNDQAGLTQARGILQSRGVDVSDVPEVWDEQTAPLIQSVAQASIDPAKRAELAQKAAAAEAAQKDRDRNFDLNRQRTEATVRSANREPLVEVYDPNSPTQTSFVPRSQAVGRPGKPPSGMNITLPDGTVINQGRGGMAEPSSSVQTETQKDVINATGALERLDEIANSYKSDYLTYGGRMRGGIASMADKAGMASKDQKDFVAGRRRFTQQVDQEFNAYRKDITGAAAAMSELESLKKAMINTDLGPAEFESAYRTYRESVARMLRLKQAILREGIPLGSRQFNKRLDDAWVGGADDSADARGMELEAQGMTEPEVVRQLKREGYTR